MAATAAFLGFDTTTLGNWSGVYGSGGRQIPNDGVVAATGTTITITQAGGGMFTFDPAPVDVRALQHLNLVGRIASCWYDNSVVKLTATGTIGTKRLQLYLNDFNSTARAATLNVYDNGTNALLDTRSVTPALYAPGVWARWQFTGDIRVEIVNTGTPNVVLNGWFVDDPTAVVPNVFNALEATAVATIAAAGFTSTITYIPATSIVVTQTPTAGTPAAAGYPINLVMLPITAGHVASQSPTAGSSAVVGSVVALLVVETVATTVTRVTQAPVELLTRVPLTRVSQEVVETLSQVTTLTRVTQEVVEVFNAPPALTRTTQLVVEVFHPILVAARVTQVAVESYNVMSSPARVTQELLELWLVLPPCISGDFPIDDAGAGGACSTKMLD